MADRHARNRDARQYGEQNGRAVLTPLLVNSIRERVENGETRAELARELGVNWSTCDRAARGIYWSAA